MGDRRTTLLSKHDGGPERRGLIDSRLVARVPATRRYLAVAVAVGVGSTATVVIQAVLLASIIDRAFLHRARVSDLVGQIIGLGAAFAARAALVWAGEFAAERTSVEVTATLRRQLLRQALALGPGWLAGERSGELTLTATRGIAALETYFARYLPQAVLAVLAPFGILAWVGLEDWVSALILVGLVALVPLAMVRFGREATKRTERQWRRLSSLSARFLELIQGLPTLRALGRADHGRQEVAEATEGLRQTTMGTLRVSFLSALSMELLSGLGVGLVAMVLGLRLLNGWIPLTTALAVLLVSPEVFLPLRRAGAEFHASTEGQAAAARILDILELSETAEETGRAAGFGPPAESDQLGAPDPSTQPLRIEGLTIVYRGRSERALDNFDLTLHPGEHLALIGPSGSGKSTVLAALLGFVNPEAGSISVGSVDLATVAPAEWRRRVTWVPQRPYIFHGTIEENLRLGDPGADPAQLQWAMEICGLADYLSQLPAGLNTHLGEGGLTLSAGERQRLAIARAVLRDAPLVLLDEPAGHLDAVTEGQLRASLDEWLAARTVIVAAHRSEVVARIDRVITLSSRPVPEGPDLTAVTPARR